MSTRRHILLFCAAALAACSDWVDPLDLGTNSRECRSDHERLLTALGLGDIDLSALLKHAPTREQLADVLRNYGPRWQQLRSITTASELRTTLHRWIAQDFENGALTEIDGWWLTSTEAMALSISAHALEPR